MIRFHHWRSKRILFCALSLMFAIQSAFSDEGDSFNEITSVQDLTEYFMSISVASKTQENISEAPGVISVITQDELKRFGGATLADVIQRAPSLQFIGSHLFPENSMVIRGDLQSHYDNHILILINGRPFRDDIAGGQNATFYEIFPIDVVDHIEFIRGPGSVLYGTNAFDGVMNIITKKPSKEIEADITAGGGSFSSKLGKATAGYKKGSIDVVANINGFIDDGWDFKATTVYPNAEQDLSGSMKYYKDKLSGSIFLTVNDFSLNAYCATVKRGILGQSPIWQMGAEKESWLDEKRAFFDIGYSRKVMKNYTLNANATFNYCKFQSHSALASSAENSYSALEETSISGPIIKHLNFILGGTTIDSWNVTVPDQKIPKGNEFYFYAYSQIDYTLIDKIKLFTGAQYNKSPTIDGVVVPRIGGIVQITDKLGAKLNFAEAFRSAMPLEKRTYFPTVVVGNPLLTPEIVKTADFQVFYNLKKVQSALTLFNSNYSDLIGRIPHPTITNTSSYANIGTMNIRGMEVESKAVLTSQLFVEGSATIQEEIDGKVLTPKYLAKGGVSYNSPFGLNVGVFNNYYGRPKRTSTGKGVNPEAKEVHLVSINIDYTLPFYKPVTINLFIQNSFNQDYYFPEFDKKWVNTLPLEPGRAIYGTVSYNF
jgi:outer membrane receptor for ferrienterochelin and colicins